MRVLVDIGHPAHVHYFKNLANEIQKKGGEVLFTSRNKEISEYLLRFYKFNFISFGKPFRTLPGKILGLIYYTFRLIWEAVRFHPDFFLNATPYSAIAAWLLRKPHFSIEDTFNMEQVRIYRPFTSVIFTSDYEHHPDLGRKEIKIRAYNETLYLHKNYFKPDPDSLKILNLKEGDVFSIIRFVGWTATHDYGQTGISEANKIKVVEEFEKFGKVFISAESNLPEKLEKYRIKLPYEKMHDVLYYSSLIYGEGATMAAEGVLLGTPTIYLSSNIMYLTIHHAQKGKKIYNYNLKDKGQSESIEKGKDILRQSNGIKKIQIPDDEFNIDFTKLLLWAMEEYPNSIKVLHSNPDFQNEFR